MDNSKKGPLGIISVPVLIYQEKNKTLQSQKKERKKEAQPPPPTKPIWTRSYQCNLPCCNCAQEKQNCRFPVTIAPIPTDDSQKISYWNHFFLMAVLIACGSFQARDWICTPAVTMLNHCHQETPEIILTFKMLIKAWVSEEVPRRCNGSEPN